MHRSSSTTLTILSLTTLITSISASGVPLVVSPGLNISTHPNVSAHLPSCTNLTTAPTIPCYTTLNTTAYLNNYNLTSPEVCAPYESWSKCLLQAVYQAAGARCVPKAPSVSKCQPFDCASLNSTTCIQPQRSNVTGITMYEAAGWYAAWNVYAVHHHIRAWASALNKTSSEHAILAAVNPLVANNATSVLMSVIRKHSINPNADKGLLDVLENTGHGEQAYGNSRGRGEQSTLTGKEWSGVLVDRLAVVLRVVNFDFGEWLGMVESGAYSTRGLSGSGALANRLKAS